MTRNFQPDAYFHLDVTTHPAVKLTTDMPTMIRIQAKNDNLASGFQILLIYLARFSFNYLSTLSTCNVTT